MGGERRGQRTGEKLQDRREGGGIVCVWGWGGGENRSRESSAEGAGGRGEGERRGEGGPTKHNSCFSLQWYAQVPNSTVFAVPQPRALHVHTRTVCLGLNVLQKCRPTGTTSIVQVSLPGTGIAQWLERRTRD